MLVHGLQRFATTRERFTENMSTKHNIGNFRLFQRCALAVAAIPSLRIYQDAMKIKEAPVTASIAWTDATQPHILLAAGTSSQQMDATFR